MQYDKAQIEYVKDLREQGYMWPEIQVMFNKKFKVSKTHNALRFALTRSTELQEAGLEEVDVSLLRQARLAAKSSNKNRKALNLALDAIDTHEDLLEGIQSLISGMKLPKLVVKAKKPKAAANASMIVEVLLSDLHYGKKTNSFNSVVARQRMKYYGEEVIRQVMNHEKLGYAVERLDLGFLGDIIESSTMHGAESLKGCEFGNSEQVMLAIQSLFEDFLVPIAHLGIPMRAWCVAGNHERVEQTKTYNKPGKEYLSWVIYNTLDMLCTKVFKGADIKFEIAEGPVLGHYVFDDFVVYEHYDLTGGCTKKSLQDMMGRRQTQLKTVVQYYRGGHYHEFTIFDRGRIIVNGCLPGSDGYSESLGFSTEATQAINFYSNAGGKKNTYAYSIPVLLESL